MSSQKPSNSSRTDRAEKAVTEVMKCVDDGFTGNITIDFSEGVAMLCRKTEVQRWPKDADPQTLDGGTRPR